MRIVQLLIDELDFFNEEVGIDGIALVKRPAHEENWLAFNKEKTLKNIYEVLDDTQMKNLAEALIEIGENEEDILDEGYELYKVEELSNPNNFVGDISSNPNADSSEDYAGIRVRYRYVGPIIPTSRDFCREMISANKVYRIEDIERMTATQANDEFGYYSIWQWRGSYNCAHRWVKLTYKAVNPNEGIAQNRILNDPSESTETIATANNKRIRLTSQDFKMIDVIDNNPLFDNREEALEVANIMGCKGVHVHDINGKDHYMPCERHPESMDIDVSSLPIYSNETGGTITENLKFNYNDDKMEITGAALIPNKLIIRSDFKGEPYWVFFDEDTVKRLSFKFMKDKRLDATNIEHTSKKASDTYVVESWVISSENNDKSNALGLEYPKGSWVITMKTDDAKVWKDIKDGKYLGFSVEGFFEEKQVFNNYDYYMSSIKTILNNIKYDE